MHSSLYIHETRLLGMILIYSLIETREGHRIISTRPSYHANTKVDPKVPILYLSISLALEVGFKHLILRLLHCP